MIKRLLSLILSIIVAVWLFLLFIMLFPMKTKTLEKAELTYIFIDDDWTEYNIFEETHWAAKDWSFLFRPKTWNNLQDLSGFNQTWEDIIESWDILDLTWEFFSDTWENITWEDIILEDTWLDLTLTGDLEDQESGSNIWDDYFTWELDDDIENLTWDTGELIENTWELVENTWELVTENTWESVNTWDKWNVLWTIDYIWDIVENSGDTQNIDTWDVETWNTWDDVVVDPKNPFNLPEWAIEKPTYKDCETPWWIKIKHDESILAYQQRADVPDICNVQRRTCNNWVLDWTFVQPSCNESVSYVYTSKGNNVQKENSNMVVYTKKEVVSTSSQNANPYVQNPKHAKYDSAEFDKNWKIKTWSPMPITDRDENWDNWEASEEYSVEQVNIDHYNCRTPWWEIVTHGQFVRAYEFPYWFTNSTCKIELRLCVDGELKWSYKYRDCEYLETTYEEYYSTWDSEDRVDWWEHNITNKEKKWFWNRLKNLFKKK